MDWPEPSTRSLRAGAVANSQDRGRIADREIPPFAPRHSNDGSTAERRSGERKRGTVLLWPDTFTNHFHPHIGAAAVRVLTDAGWNVVVPTEPMCCGLTWISTGQLATAKKVLTRTIGTPGIYHVRAGGLVVGLEPSCTAVFRADAAELSPKTSRRFAGYATRPSRSPSC